MLKQASIILFAVLASSFMVYSFTKIDNSNIENQALAECIEAVQNKCSPVITYASMLEEENARLNRVLKEMRGKCTVTQ